MFESKFAVGKYSRDSRAVNYAPTIFVHAKATPGVTEARVHRMERANNNYWSKRKAHESLTNSCKLRKFNVHEEESEYDSEDGDNSEEDIVAHHVRTEEECQDERNSEDDCSEQNFEQDIAAHVDTEEEFHDEHNYEDDYSEHNFEQDIVAHVDTEEERQDEHNSEDDCNEQNSEEYIAAHVDTEEEFHVLRMTAVNTILRRISLHMWTLRRNVRMSIILWMRTMR